MSKLDKLSPEQELQLVKFREEWYKHGISTEVVDVETTKKTISRMYELIGKKPPVFIFCPSLMFAQYQIAFCKTVLKEESFKANLWDNLRDNLGDNLWANLRDNLRDNLNYEKTDFWGSMDAYWIAFYEYPEKFLGINYTPDQSEKLKLWSEIAKSSSWFWTYENYCFVADRPTEINMNEGNRLNNLEGPSIKWSDGYEIYYVNGREIGKKEFYAIKNKSYTIEMFFGEKNEEKKSACLQLMTELYGENYIVSFFSSILKEVSTYVDKKEDKYLKGTTGGMNIGVYTLFSGSLSGYDISYVRCYCPSTDRMFYLGVEPVFTNAKDAIASLYTIPSLLKPHIKSIRRQGERFSTTFTDKGLALVKNISKIELEKLVSLSGDEYFKKIEFEF